MNKPDAWVVDLAYARTRESHRMSRQIAELLFVFSLLSLPVAVVAGLLFGVVSAVVKRHRTRSTCAERAPSAASPTA